MPQYQKIGHMRDRIRALDFLRTVCDNIDGYSKYHEGWSDKKVSRTIKSLSTKVIADLRREYIGKSRPHMERYKAGVGAAMLNAKRQKHILEQLSPARQDNVPALIVPQDRLTAIEAKVDALLTALGVEVRKEI
jgi:hypothetical protein